MHSRFTYVGSRDMYPDLYQRSQLAKTDPGYVVQVLYRVGTDEDVDPLYRVRFPDGYQHDAFDYELDPQPDPATPFYGVLRPLTAGDAS